MVSFIREVRVFEKLLVHGPSKKVGDYRKSLWTESQGQLVKVKGY